MSLEPESDPNLERPVTPSRRRVNAPILRSQSRQEEIRLACLKGDLTSLESLVKGNTENINELFQDGWSPLMVAVNGANPSIVKFLLGQGADPNKCRADGFSPLMAALTSSRGQVLVHQCAQLLIDAGADTSSRSDDGLTPLLLAVKDNRVPVVDLLVFHGADLNAEDSTGRTASQLAQERGLDQILLTLEKHGNEKPNISNTTKLENTLSTKSETNCSNDTDGSCTVTSDIIPESSSSRSDLVEDKIVKDLYESHPPTPETEVPPSPEQLEMDESLEMVKKDNVLAAIESNTAKLPDSLELEAESSLHKQTEKQISGNRPGLQFDAPDEPSSPCYSKSTANSSTADAHKGRDAIVLKIGLAVGLFASVVGAYYAKFYLEKR